MTDTPDVSVVGLGTIGLPTALLFAREHDVVGVDVDPDRVERLENGELPIDEPGMEELFPAERFRASTELEPADVHVLAVPTPLDRATGVADLGHVRAAAESVAGVLREGDVVVVESTVPPGTCERLVEGVLADAVDEPRYAYCPERAIPGRTVEEMVDNDRVVGASDPATGDRVEALYRSFVEGEIARTGPTTAEFVKLTENTYRDVNIALANEFAKLAEDAGVDVHEVIGLANRHPRVDVLDPGPGVGGHCITVDPWFLTETTGSARLVPLARDVNDSMPDHVLRLVRRAIGDTPGPEVAVLGVAYKGNVGDTRETPARRFIRRARNDGYGVRVHDPHAERFDEELMGLEAALDGADCAVVLTDHDEYARLDPEAFDGMASRQLVDARAVVDADRLRAAGVDVTVLGDGS
jgi:UDP-N-acetyl-D-mannosaminuronic acid dehydrogenase